MMSCRHRNVVFFSLFFIRKWTLDLSFVGYGSRENSAKLAHAILDKTPTKTEKSIRISIQTNAVVSSTRRAIM